MLGLYVSRPIFPSIITIPSASSSTDTNASWHRKKTAEEESLYFPRISPHPSISCWHGVQVQVLLSTSTNTSTCYRRDCYFINYPPVNPPDQNLLPPGSPGVGSVCKGIDDCWESVHRDDNHHKTRDVESKNPAKKDWWSKWNEWSKNPAKKDRWSKWNWWSKNPAKKSVFQVKLLS